MTTGGRSLPGAVGLLRGLLFGFRLGSADDFRGSVYGGLGGFLEDGEGFGAGVVDGFDGFIGCLGGGLEDLGGQLLGVLDCPGTLIVSLEGGSVGACVGLVVDVGGEVGVQTGGKEMQLSSYCEAVREIAQGGGIIPARGLVSW